MRSVRELQQRWQKHILLEELNLLIADTLGKDVTYLHTHPETKISLKQAIKVRYQIEQRKRGYSIAAIIGHKEFFGFDFIVSKHTLIPRPETELLIEEALIKIQDKTLLIDVGTGSGCIPVTLVSKTKAKMIAAYAIDIDKKALIIARKNAEKYNASIRFLQGNLLEPLEGVKFPDCSNVVITANLPYLRHDQFTSEPSIQREPYHALVAEKNGLALYEKLLAQTQTLITLGVPVYIFMEIDPSQSENLRTIVQELLPKSQIEIKNDLARQDRLALVTINS